MNPLNKLVAAITVIFAVCLLVLVIQSIYVLWRRRRLRQVVTGSVRDVEFSGEHLPSKELLYFFCCRNQKTTRVEPDGALAAVEATAPPLMPSPSEEEVDQMLKHKGLYGPSRCLFTIKEEEREEMECDHNLPCSSTTEKKVEKMKVDETGGLGEASSESEAQVIAEADETTPFSTPCASPPYYTPSPSPTREGNCLCSTASDVVVLGIERNSVSIEIGA